MANPFDDPNHAYLVLVNSEGQHSLWPDFVKMPEGWHPSYGPAARQDCLDYIEKNWTDMRPRSLAVEMSSRQSAA